MGQNTAYAVLPILSLITNENDILLFFADSCLFPQLAQNAWGKNTIFFFSSVAVSSPFFLFSFVCCLSLMTMETKRPFVKSLKECAI